MPRFALTKFLISPALLAAFVTGGCTMHEGAPGTPHASSKIPQQAAIPFTQAILERKPDGTRNLSWTSLPGTSKVIVYSGPSPSTIDRDRPIGRGSANDAIMIDGSDGREHVFFELVPDRGAPLIITERRLQLDGSPNFRDVGGYRTVDGRWVRMGLLYRSDQLDRLSDDDLARLKAMGLGLVLDLRTSAERQREPDRVPSGAEHLVIDILADTAPQADATEMLKRLSNGEGEPFMLELSRNLVASNSARLGYTEMFGRLKEQETTAAVFHCTAGKDRTGWASAVLLTALGVPRETVIADYLASNANLAAKNTALFKHLPGTVTQAQAEPVLTVRRQYIEAAFAEVEARYGSFEKYLEEGLGINPARLEALRDRFLSDELVERPSK